VVPTVAAMFGRRPRVDPEVVAAARRRLEALSSEPGATMRQGAVTGTGPHEPAAKAPVVHEPTGTESAAGHAPDGTGPAAQEPFATEPGDLIVSDTDDLPEPSPRHAARPLGYDVRLLDRVCDLLPLSARGRAGFTSHHVTVIALLVACVTAVGAWLALRSTPQTVTVPTIPAGRPTITTDVGGAASPAVGWPAPTPVSGVVVTPQAGPTAATASVAATIVVDVAGKVRQPGIVELSTGARVVDAIDAAGGARPQVDLSGLNLARPLVDGEQILVGVPPVAWPAGQPSSVASPSSVTSPAGLVNLNTASQEELESLPGVGPVTATAILTWRTEHGAFSSVDELLEISGIGDATLADLAPLVTV